jgi:hypothetical protein
MDVKHLWDMGDINCKFLDSCSLRALGDGAKTVKNLSIFKNLL